MGNKEKTPVNIDGVQYKFEDMSNEQQTLINHLVDLDRKISSSQFNLDQLTVGKQAFMNMLKDSLAQNGVIDIEEKME